MNLSGLETVPLAPSSLLLARKLGGLTHLFPDLFRFGGVRSYRPLTKRALSVAGVKSWLSRQLEASNVMMPPVRPVYYCQMSDFQRAASSVLSLLN